MSDDIQLLVVVVSCKKNAGLWSNILNRGVQNLIILCGGSDETHLDGKILHLKCVDTYDGLSEKMLRAFEYISTSDSFKAITHILKADDHDTDFTAEQINKIPMRYKAILNSHDYIGQHMVNRALASRWHFGKVPKESKWHNKECIVPPIPYCGGGETYILSRKSLNYLRMHVHEHEEYLYEDAMVGLLLNKYDITPYKLYYGIKTWRGPTIPV